jgi:type I restriction enzyme R subunit
LPHWEIVDGRYFVTLHVHGALPTVAVAEIESLAARLRGVPSSEFLRLSRRIFGCMEEWLHRTAGWAPLREPRVAKVVSDSIRTCHARGLWKESEWVVMPNHVHLFFLPGTLGMTQAMRKFKRWTTREANAVLGSRGAKLWQEEWFDHWSRSAEEDARIRNYIRNNPVLARLVERAEEWRYGSWSQ